MMHDHTEAQRKLVTLRACPSARGVSIVGGFRQIGAARRRGGLTRAACLVLGALLFARSALAQSIGDLAKQTQADHEKRAGTPSKTYSDKDLHAGDEIELPPAPTVPGKWRRHETISKMDDSRIVVYQLHAEAGPDGPVMLGASCIGGMTGPMTLA